MAVKVSTPEIRLHCGPTGLNEAVLSLDFLRPNEADASPLLATGGADKEIKLWRVGKDAALDFVFSLSGHDRSVNCVRFSPNGAYLASASDDTSIILWTKPKTAGDDWRWDQISSLSDVGRCILSLGHKGDITDLSWSPDSAFLCSSSVDNRCVIWDVDKGDVAERRKDHTQYVQGVAWDPLNEFLVTEGNDRTCRVYSLSGFGAATRPNGKKKQGRKFMCIQTLKTREFPSKKTEVKEGTGEKDSKTTGADTTGDVVAKTAKHRMFLDDTCPAFARRPAWTPDASYFLVPTGTFRASESAPPVNTVYAFSRGNLSQPALHLPGQDKASLGVRCSPLLYELRRQEDQPDSSPTPNFFKTKFRSVFAVITLDAVVIYDTQQAHPVCTIKGLHYADLTDASWTADGQTLSISSTDGYISFIQFEDGFFGTSVPRKDQLALNEDKMRRMFATPKKARKKARSQAQSAQKEQTPAKTATTKTVTAKQKAQPSDPIKRAFQNSEGSTAAAPVNLVQVRKKRKISPTLVTTPAPVAAEPQVAQTIENTPTASTPAATSASAAASTPATSASTTTSTPTDTAAVDLSAPATSESAAAGTQPTETHSPAGTFDDPLDI